LGGRTRKFRAQCAFVNARRALRKCAWLHVGARDTTVLARAARADPTTMTSAPATRVLSHDVPARDVLLASLAAAPTTADATGELDAADVLESFDLVKEPRADVTFLGHSDTLEVPSVRPDALDVPFDASLAVGGSDAFFARPEPISTGAVTFELDDTAHAQAVRAPRRLGWVVAICLAAACTLVVSAAITERVSGGEPSTSTAATSLEGASRTASLDTNGSSANASNTNGSKTNGSKTNASNANGSNANGSNANASSADGSSANATPTIDVKSLRPALVGTLVAPSKTVLYVDGKRADGATALVTCGRHTVRLGARGKARAVDVPCGGQLALR
jgi:hypothetical protein